MSKVNQQTISKHSGIISKSPLLLVSGLCVGLALSAFSGIASAADTSNDQAAQPTRSPAFQKRLDAEKAAEDQRDRDHALQEQARKEEIELKRFRAERAAQRNAAAAAAKQQEEQQRQQQQQQQK
jgi:hypothetical protein